MKEFKCDHPYCDEIETSKPHKLILIPALYGYQTKFYCTEHVKYAKQLAKSEEKRLLDTHRGVKKDATINHIPFLDFRQPTLRVDTQSERIIIKRYNLLPAKKSRKKTVEIESAVGKRKLIYERDGNKCLCCGSNENLTLDHIIPKSLGGSNAEDNLQTLCRKCNGEKGNRIRDYRNTKILIQREPKSFSPK